MFRCLMIIGKILSILEFYGELFPAHFYLSAFIAAVHKVQAIVPPAGIICCNEHDGQ